MKNKKKTPNKKRIIARIIALVAMLCAIMVLAIPCFADPPTFVVNDMYYDYYEEHYLYPWNTNYSVEVLLNSYKSGAVSSADANMGLFACKFLYGVVPNDSATLGFSHNFQEDSSCSFSFSPEYCVVHLDDSRDGSQYNFYSESAMVTVEAYAQEESGLVTVNFLDYSTGKEFIIYYSGSRYDDFFDLQKKQIDVLTNGVLERSFIGVELQDVGAFSFGLTVRNGYIDDSLALNVLASVVGGAENVFNRIETPFSWACGFTTGTRGEEGGSNWQEGFQAGKEQGLTQGRKEGYDSGAKDGYEKGKQDGIASIEGTDTYKKGYDDAVKQISDGDFGRNLLGGIFSAPLQALEEFTIVSWTAEDGTVIDISIAALFSAAAGVLLVIWFLKMFAGG